MRAKYRREREADIVEENVAGARENLMEVRMNDTARSDTELSLRWGTELSLCLATCRAIYLLNRLRGP